MKSDVVWEIGKYDICNGKVFNRITGNEIQKTVKGYTVGFYLSGKFRSLNWINQNATKKIHIKCPF